MYLVLWKITLIIIWEILQNSFFTQDAFNILKTALSLLKKEIENVFGIVENYINYNLENITKFFFYPRCF
jgi:hypothetical protein